MNDEMEVSEMRKTDPVMKPCGCGKEPKVTSWYEPGNGGSCFIECSCGMMVGRVDRNSEVHARQDAIEIWNRGVTPCMFRVLK